VGAFETKNQGLQFASTPALFRDLGLAGEKRPQRLDTYGYFKIGSSRAHTTLEDRRNSITDGCVWHRGALSAPNDWRQSRAHAKRIRSPVSEKARVS
jgi:hypothetical protein